MNSYIGITHKAIRFQDKTSQQTTSQRPLTWTNLACPPRKHQIIQRQRLSSKITIFNTRPNAVKNLILCSISSRTSIWKWPETTILPRLRSPISSPLRKSIRICHRIRRLQALTLRSWRACPPGKAKSNLKRHFLACRRGMAMILIKKL